MNLLLLCVGKMASKRGPECDGSDDLSEKRRRVAFDEVKVFRFRRRQGYVCVPSQVFLFIEQKRK